MPKLPVASAPVEPHADLQTSAEVDPWLGPPTTRQGVHEFQAVDIEQLRTFADIMGIEFVW